MRPVRVVLVDGHEMVRAGLKSMLADHPDVRIVGEAADAPTGVQIVQNLEPDVVLTEMRLGKSSGVDVCRDLLAWCADARVVILTTYDDEHHLSQALGAGARGYLLKQISAEDLVTAIHRVRAGELVVAPSMAGQTASTATGPETEDHRPGGHLGLTMRESEVLALIVTGMTKASIASRLVVGEETVKTHVRSIYRKLDVNDRASALAKAMREGLIR